MEALSTSSIIEAIKSAKAVPKSISKLKTPASFKYVKPILTLNITLAAITAI